METENQTDDTQVDASQLNAATGDEAESVATESSEPEATLTLKEINELTGMSYKDKDSALKSIKDMKSQAGKAADLEGKLKAAATDGNGNQSDEAINELKEQLNQLQTANFYANHPDADRDLVETIAKANGITREEALDTDLYKKTVAAPEKRTIAGSNNRVAQTSKEFNPKDHAGDADALAKFVTDTYLKS